MEWDLIADSGALKKKHERMVSELSEAYDALYGVKEKAGYLSGQWKGRAEEVFESAFLEEWQKTEVCLREIGKLLSTLVKAERTIRHCEEKTIPGILGKGGDKWAG